MSVKEFVGWICVLSIALGIRSCLPLFQEADLYLIPHAMFFSTGMLCGFLAVSYWTSRHVLKLTPSYLLGYIGVYLLVGAIFHRFGIVSGCAIGLVMFLSRPSDQASGSS